MFFREPELKILREDEWTSYGVGYCSAHYGDLLQGQFPDDTGESVRALVTLPYRKRGVVSQVAVCPGAGRIRGPVDKSKTKATIKAYLELHGLTATVNVRFTLQSNIEVGIGLGSSTSDIVATVRALDHALGNQTLPDAISRLAVDAEVACDSTMHQNQAVLFAQRHGTVLEAFPNRLPQMTVLGINLAPGQVFPTSEISPAVYSSAEISEFGELRSRLRSAIEKQCVRSVADVATQSSKINQKHFPKPGFLEFLKLADDNGALGVSVSHSGTVGALLFPIDTGPRGESIARILAVASESGFAPVDQFIV